MIYRVLDRCLACGGDKLRQYLDLGEQPLANAFHDGATELLRYPLGLKVCTECWHSQSVVAVDPHLMFDNYLYVSGTSRTLREYFEQFVGRVEARHGAKLRVLDIGCNDCSLLTEFFRRGHEANGVDPSDVDMALEAAFVKRSVGYWDREMAEHIARYYHLFDVIVAMNVLGHVADPLEFLALAKRVLAPHGRIYIQTSQASMIPNAEFDTVYHEHLSFFCERSFAALAKRVELNIARISRVPVHGGSYLVEMVAEPCDQVIELNSGEISDQAAGIYDETTYNHFQYHVYSVRDISRRTLALYAPRFDHVIGYGAAAKGMVFLSYTGIRPEMIVDDNPLKVGLLCPGSDIPVVGPEGLSTMEGKCLFLILAWNFADEIIARIKARRQQPGDAFMTFLPTVTLR